MTTVLDDERHLLRERSSQEHQQADAFAQDVGDALRVRT